MGGKMGGTANSSGTSCVEALACGGRERAYFMRRTSSRERVHEYVDVLGACTKTRA